jgi:hypothetical protein
VEGNSAQSNFETLNYGDCRQSALDALTSSRRIITTISSKRSYADVRYSVLRDSAETQAVDKTVLWRLPPTTVG